MLKKLFKALTTLTLLVGCYFGYVHVFAIVVEQLSAVKRTDNFAFAVKDSKSRQESIRYAIEACGADHWAADKDLALPLLQRRARVLDLRPRTASGSSRKTVCVMTASAFA